MVNRKKKAFWIAGGVCLAVIALIITRPSFRRQTSQIPDRSVGVECPGNGSPCRRGERLPIPVLGASLADVTVKNGGADVATVAHMKVGLKLLPLFRGKVKISRLELVKPVVSIVRQKDGTLNIKTRKGKPSGKRVALKKLVISGGSLLYTDLRSGGKTELEGIDITVRDLSAGGTPGGDPLKTLSFTGDFRCRAIKAGNFTLTDLEMKAVGGRGVFDVRHAGDAVLGGTGSGTLHADFTGTEPYFRIIVAVSRLKIQDLLQESPNAKGMEGLADLSADLTARGTTALEVKRSLSGQVSLSGENIVLNGLDIDDLISSLQRSRRFNLVDVGAFFLAGPLGPVLTRAYRFADLYKESQGGKGSSPSSFRSGRSATASPRRSMSPWPRKNAGSP